MEVIVGGWESFILLKVQVLDTHREITYKTGNETCYV